MKNYYYSYKVKEMMKLSKKNNIEMSHTINDNTIFVKYFKELDDFILQYSWIIPNEDISLNQDVKDVLNKYQTTKYNENQISQILDVVQIGLITVYSKDAEDLCGLIGDCKDNLLTETNDTNYIFCCKKVLRVIQYHGKVSYPLEYLSTILRWDNSSVKSRFQLNGMKTVEKGIKYKYSKKNTNVIFSVGNERTTFAIGANDNIPDVITIDTFLGIIEHDIKNII